MDTVCTLYNINNALLFNFLIFEVCHTYFRPNYSIWELYDASSRVQLGSCGNNLSVTF